jgi:ankyrin repeat protein
MKGLAGIALLIRAGANPNVQEADGDTPLSTALKSCPSLVKPLLDGGSDPNISGSEGLRPLHRAISNHSVAAVEALLKAGALHNDRTPAGDTAMTLAAKQPSTPDAVEIARLLAVAGASADELDGNGQSANELASANSAQMALAVRGALPPKPPAVVLPPPVVAPPRIFPR